MRTFHEIKYQNKNNFLKKQSLKVNSFHNFGIDKKSLGTNLEIIAFATDNTIEEFKHYKYKIYGTMWHPERETNYKKINKLIKFIK